MTDEANALPMRTVCPACNSRFEEGITYCPKDGTPLVPDSADPMGDDLTGQVIDARYRVVRKLGEGGMGEVYEARHVFIEKRVALKLLRKEILSNTEAVTRFHQEARSASSIGHENIIAIEDFGKLPDGRVYLAMEFLDGQALDEIMEEPVPVPRALDLMAQTCRGLAAAHAKGIVHRDMKPENIWVTHPPHDPTRDLVKILDFGIAKVSGAEGGEHLTRTGTIFGTPFYMAPEQALGRAIDHRADVYALGVILYQLFTGRVPFRAETFMGILTQHITTPPTPPREVAPERNIPPEVEAIILRAMAKNPAERQQSMGELLGEILQVQGIYGMPLSGGASALMAVPIAPAARTGSVARPTPVPLPDATVGAVPGRVSTASQAAAGGLAPMASLGNQTAWPLVGQSLTQEQPAARRAGPIVALALLLLAVGGGVVAMVLHGHQSGSSQAAAAPPPVRMPAETVIVPAAGSSIQHARNVTYAIDSTPEGADILVDQVVVGQTPFQLDEPAGADKVVTLRLAGYQDQAVLLDRDTKLTVTLEKAAGAATPGATRATAAKTPPRPAGPGHHDHGKSGGQAAHGQTPSGNSPSNDVLNQRVDDSTDDTQLHSY